MYVHVRHDPLLEDCSIFHSYLLHPQLLAHRVSSLVSIVCTLQLMSVSVSNCSVDAILVQNGGELCVFSVTLTDTYRYVCMCACVPFVGRCGHVLLCGGECAVVWR